MLLVISLYICGMKQIIIAVILLLFHLNIWSQRFRHYGIEKGLLCSLVVDIAVDNKDRVWAATDNGLSVYDGISFITFTTHNSHLSDNGLNAILYDEKADVLWIATKNKVSALHCDTYQFLDVENTEFSGFQFLAKASDGGIWAGCRGDGLVKYSDTGKLILSKKASDLHGIPASFISVYDDNGCIYIGSVFGGMSIVDLLHNRVKRFVHDENNPYSIPGNQVYDFCRDGYGRLWVGTDHGLALFDESEGKFYNFKHENDNPNSLIADHIYSIEIAGNGDLWISTDIGGISILSPQSVSKDNLQSVSFHNIRATYDETGLSSPNIRKVQEDRFGNYWIANYSSGISCLQHARSRFEKLMEAHCDGISYHKSVRGLYYDNQANALWAGTDNEIIVFDRDGKVNRRYDLTKYLVRPNGKVYCISRHEDEIYFGVRDNGLFALDPQTGRVERKDFGENVDVNALWTDNNGVMWIGTQVGAFCLKNDHVYKNTKVADYLDKTSVFGFLRDDAGNLWISTFGRGIFVFDSHFDLKINLTEAKGLLTGNINCTLLKDRGGNIWAGTQNGLVKFCKGQWDKTESVGFSEGLQDEMIHAITEDVFCHIWIGTDKGISSYDPLTKEIHNYSYKDGIPYGNIQHGSVTKDGYGRIYFGTNAGICRFSPAYLLNDVKCSDIRILEQDVEGDEQRFRFCVADEAQRDIVEYFYRIKGISEQWINIGDQTELNFHGLASGNYTFEVKACVRNVKNSETSVESCAFYIAPPFWKSWWAYMLYALFLILVVTYLFLSYRRKILLETSLEIARRNNINEQRINNEKLKFFTNITHELRTPLTLIIGPLEDMKYDKRLPETVHRKLNAMYTNSLQLLQLVNEILEFRKTESETRKLTVERCCLGNIVRETWLRFKESNRNEAIEFVMSIPDDDAPVYVDVNAIKTILNNLISNAIKYTERGTIGIVLTRCENKIKLTVSDTGSGIDAKTLPHIFDRYYQGGGDHQKAGTGIGLAVVKTLAELHKGSIEVSSSKDKGTAFTLILNANEDYPDAVHNEKPVRNDDIAKVTDVTVATDNRKRLILIVEDNEDIRNYIAQAFEKDYMVLMANNGSEGLRLANEQMPDIIISDIMMPQMDGVTMCRKIKSDVRTSHIPVILLTAKNSLEDQTVGYEIGADAYLTKPFSSRLLIACVNNQFAQMARLVGYINKNLGLPCSGQVESVDEIPQVSTIDAAFFEQLKDIIYARISDSELSIDDICMVIGLSHSTLYRKVKALTGLTINEFIRKQRLHHAKGLLMESGHNVSEVAYLCGFNDLRYFISCFKKEFNQTPSTYIRKDRPHEV